MPAAIDSGKDRLGFFKSAFLSRSEPAWHGLGTVFDKARKITVAEALAESYVGGWDVRTLPITVHDTDGKPLDPSRYASEYQAVVRTSPFDGVPELLHVAGERYETFQNEAALTFADNLLDGGVIETIGSIQGGRKVFMSLRMRNGLTLDPNGRKDKINNYLLVATSHDGTLPLVAMNTPVRVVCQNTLSMALSGSRQRYTIRHTGSMAPKVEEARTALAINVGYMDAFSREATKMIEATLTTDAFVKIVKDLYPEPKGDSKAAATRWTKRIELLEAIYTGQADGPNTQAKITGTVWGGLNAATEFLDWYRNPRKGDAESVLSAASGFDAVAAQSKARTVAAFRSLVKV
jgi:phage/plasmid-like protein (TIGR03299 family)